MNTKLYTGNGGTNAQTGVGFQPDWVWLKQRSGSASSNKLYDSVRGTTKYIASNNDGAEATDSNGLTAFGTDGFTVGSSAGTNANNETYVGWNWKAGTSFSNSAGANGASLASTGSVNTTSGFSIISFAGASAVSTVAHGLGAAPKMIIFKNRSDADAWGVYHESIGSNAALYLNETAGSDGTLWNNTAPTSSVFTVQNNSAVNGSGNNIIAYCFAEKQGYSKFSSYEGNGNVNGTFIYTGFKPAFVMVKPVDASDNWVMFDNKRDTFNSSTSPFNFYANTAGVETTDTGQLDFTAQGFKIRNGGNTVNRTSTFIYMAFAENPFVASNYNAATAR